MNQYVTRTVRTTNVLQHVDCDQPTAVVLIVKKSIANYDALDAKLNPIAARHVNCTLEIRSQESM